MFHRGNHQPMNHRHLAVALAVQIRGLRALQASFGHGDTGAAMVGDVNEPKQYDNMTMCICNKHINICKYVLLLYFDDACILCTEYMLHHASYTYIYIYHDQFHVRAHKHVYQRLYAYRIHGISYRVTDGYIVVCWDGQSPCGFDGVGG